MPALPLAYDEPMKASQNVPVLDDGSWIYEVKLDGYRLLAVKNGKKVDLWSRNKKSFNDRFPLIAKAISKLAIDSAIFDGEICGLTAEGTSSFQLLQNNEDETEIVYYVFDALNINHVDLTSLTLLERKRRLKTIIGKAPFPLQEIPVFEGDQKLILAEMEKVGIEGCIAKKRNSIYEPGRRSKSWVKIKFHFEQEFVVIGYTSPRNSRHYFGALILGYYRAGKLVFAGRVGTGFSEKCLRILWDKLRPLASDMPNIEGLKNPSGKWRLPGWKPSDNHWVQPTLVAQVRFREWTEDGILRQPSFLGLRDDKNAKEVRRE